MHQFAGRLTKTIAIVAALGIVISALTIQSSSAAGTEQSITLAPATTAISEKPGDTYKSKITVLNEADNAVNVKIYAAPYSVKGLEYTPSFSQLPGTTDASKWVALKSQEAQIDAHKQAEVGYQLTIPANTAPGGYYAVIFVQTQTVKGGSGVQTSNRVGDILYITAEGDIKEGGSIKGDAIPSFTTASTLPMGVDVSNSGGTHFVTTVRISIDTFYGKNVFLGTLERYILPQTVRSVSTDWKTPVFGLFSVSRSATINGHTQELPKQWILVVQPIAFVFIVAFIIFVALVWWLLGRKRGQGRR